MQKSLLFSLFLGAATYSVAQVNVSTTPSNRVAVLEEYTGNYCTYCPDGHKIADQLDANYGSDIITLKIQTGGFANPDPIFGGSLETTSGNAIAAPYDSQGYPNGSVNREAAYSGIGRGDWSSAVADITGQSSPVNLYIESDVDVTTRTLNVSVEYYYTADAANTTNYLHIGYYQDNIPAFQYDPGFYPQNFYILSEEIYKFNHAFREMVNGNFGEQISTTTTGSTNIVNHTITLPASFNGFELEPGAIKVFAYVSSSQQGEITTAVKGSPTFTNFPTTNDAAIVFTSAAAEENCIGVNDATDPIILIANKGGNALTSLNIDYGVNGASQTQAWTGNLVNTEKEAINLNSTTFTYQANNTLNVEASSPNAVADENPADNIFSDNFSGGPSENADKIRIEVKTDAYAYDESEFNVYDGAGNLVFASGPLPNSTTASYYLTIPAGTDCYLIEMLDTYGDGWGYQVTGAFLKIYDVTQGSNTLLRTVSAENSMGERKQVATEFTSQGSHASIAEEEDFSDVKIYPNPASEKVTVDFEVKNNSETNISVINNIGQEVQSFNLGMISGKNSFEFDISDVQAGIYLVKVKTNNTESTHRISVVK